MDLEPKDGLISSQSSMVTRAFLKSINSKVNLQDIVDWSKTECDGYDMIEVNAFQYINLHLMAKIARFLGKKADSILFYRKSLLVKESINNKLFDAGKGIYVDDESTLHSSLHVNMFLLAFGLVAEKNVDTVVEFVKSKGMACRVYGVQYLLEALYQYGEANCAFNLLTSRQDRSWWNMTVSGSIMTLEVWDIKCKPNLDWNYVRRTAPANIITRYMWVITSASPDFAIVKIKPHLNALKYSKIKVPRIKGAIMANYKLRRHCREKYSIELPEEGTVREFILTGNHSKIRMNRRKVKSNSNTQSVHSRTSIIKWNE